MPLLSMTSGPGPSWISCKAELATAAKRAFVGTAAIQLNLSKQVAVENAPVYEPTNARALPRPTRQSEREFANMPNHHISGRAWIETVVKTLAVQNPGLGITDPVPDKLRSTLASSRVTVDNDEGTVSLFNRRELDAATAYTSRIIIRGMKTQPVGSGRTVKHGQLLWYDWDKNRWETASFVAHPDGSVGYLGTYSRIEGDWHGKIPGGSGYWAEQEFGTEGLQRAEFLEEDNLFIAYAGHAGTSLEVVKSRSLTGIPGRLFITRAARATYDHMRGDKRLIGEAVIRDTMQKVAKRMGRLI